MNTLQTNIDSFVHNVCLVSETSMVHTKVNTRYMITCRC